MELVVPVRVEIQKGSVAKYEWSEDLQSLVLDRMLHGSEHYRFNYGEIMGTLGGDGDALDAVIYTEHKLVPASVVYCRVVGLLETEDEKGRDEKIIVVPAKDPDMDYAVDISDISGGSRTKIKSFFENYKKHEKGKFVRVGEFQSKTVAEALVKSSFITS